MAGFLSVPGPRCYPDPVFRQGEAVPVFFFPPDA